MTGQQYRSLNTFDAHPSFLLFYSGIVALIGGAGLKKKITYTHRRPPVWYLIIAVTAAIAWTIQFFEALGQL